MKKKKLYANHFFGYDDIHCDNYIDYTCVGIHFEYVNTKPLYFFNCYFYGCTFGANPLFIFESCNFESCDFKGTFEATLSACCFADKTHVPYMPMACPADDEFIGRHIWLNYVFQNMQSAHQVLDLVNVDVTVPVC